MSQESVYLGSLSGLTWPLRGKGGVGGDITGALVHGGRNKRLQLAGRESKGGVRRESDGYNQGEG